MGTDGDACVDAHSGDCRGQVRGHASLGGTGAIIMRCDHHYGLALERAAAIDRRYPPHPPQDFDFLDAGEHWYEDLSR
ncbi:hypothetical protein [Euzebya pacifica]|uniref:hypothetical protein n=1 Tax=Euzebya pacifica TaxID=1608957 RepID=UPI0013DF2894|nr:hypothetical protein [Euzebya pacifica]